MLEEIIKIVEKAGEIVISAHLEEKQIHEKTSAADLVTTYDVAVEEFLKKELQKVFPTASFLGEEEGGNKEAKELFIIDPIDGTTNFVRGFHHSNISVAYALDGQVVMGVVYNPYAKEMFSAEKGKGSWLNGKEIHVSNKNPEHGLYLVGSSLYNKKEADKTFLAARRLFDCMADFRRLAAAALDLCYVACGRAEVYFEASLQPWDYAAGALIATEAGAVISTMEGNPIPFAQRSSIFAANKRCGNLIEKMKE